MDEIDVLVSLWARFLFEEGKQVLVPIHGAFNVSMIRET